MNDTPTSKRSAFWLLPVLAILAGGIAGGAVAIGSYELPEMRLAGHEGDVQLTGDDEGGDTLTEDPDQLMDLVGSATETNAVSADADQTVPDGKPKVFLPIGNEHDFGMMARNEKKSFSFPVRNIGKGPLTLKVTGSTCKCTVGTLEDESIPSGETRPVTLTWEAKSYAREFRQSATIETNDRSVRDIVFSVSGQVLQLAMPDLPMVQFKVRRGESKSFSTKVYAYRDTDFLITGHDFLHENLADYFDVRYEPLPKEEWEDKAATSAVLCTVDIKPGLPLGQVTQGLKLHTNKDDIDALAVSIDMNVVSDISLFGARLSKTSNMVTLNHVDGEKGWEEPMQVIVKGDHKDQVKFSIVKADPEGVLTAEFGEPEDIKRTVDGVETVTARIFPMTVIVKKGAFGVSRMGNEQGEFGVLTIDTNHPEVEQFDLRVRFLVKNRGASVE